MSLKPKTYISENKQIIREARSNTYTKIDCTMVEHKGDTTNDLN